MKKIFGALVACLISSAAFGQAQLGPGHVWGNSTAAKAPPQDATVTAILDRALASTRGAIIERGASGWQAVVPSATAGLAWISAGTGADPAYGVLGLVGGGCNAALVASNGGILYSTASACAILAGTATARLPLLSGATAAPVWGAWPIPASSGTAVQTLHGGAAPAFGAVVLTTDISGQLPFANGGCNGTTQQTCFDNAGPTATRAGDIIYWNGTHYVTLAGNNAGTNVLTENASGVPSWAAPGTGTVTNVATGGLATGGPITGTGTVTVTAATKADEQAGASGSVVVTPSQQQSHASAAKGWAFFNGVTTVSILASYNVSGIVRNAAGTYTISWTVAFATANYAVNVTCNDNGSGAGVLGTLETIGTSSIQILCITPPATVVDASKISVVVYGGQ